MTSNHPKHQTVSWWIEQLQEFDPSSVVFLSTGLDRELCLLSVYECDRPGEVCIDVGGADD